MRRILVLLAAVAFASGLLIVLQPIFAQNNSSPAPRTQGKVKPVSGDKFEPARRLLVAANVPFDPEILQRNDWRVQLRSALDAMSEMHTFLRAGKQIGGVQIADTILLPEDVQITGDTVMIANHLVFEKYHSRLKGYGTNVFVYPVLSADHIADTFEAVMARQGRDPRTFPAPGERSSEVFDLGKPIRGQTEINVDGQGSEEWQEKYRRYIGRQSSDRPQLVCPPQSPNCDGEPGAQGAEGTPGYNTYLPADPDPPLDGYCRNRNTVNGLPGEIGIDGLTGPINAGRGGDGIVGGQGGTIQFSIPPGATNSYYFYSRGGTGGMGGTGGYGAPGNRGQDGSRGGDGADCPCSEGGPGDGSDGMKGGRGGAGGAGGVGGNGGAGGSGGTVTVRYPSDFDPRNIDVWVNGGSPGNRGYGGLGGDSGASGSGGRAGAGGGNLYCSSSPPGHTGRHGGTPPPYGPSDLGPDGNAGTEHGSDGHIYLIPVPPVIVGCNEKPKGLQWMSSSASPDLGWPLMATRKNPPSTNLDEDPSCCSDLEASQCSINGGEWDWVTCLTDPAHGVEFDILNQRLPRQMSWTAENSDDAFLVLDRNGNGSIDNGRELFGSSTPQPSLGPGETKNGFRALAVFDKPSRGGNGDGKIGPQDQVYNELRLWRDQNHNGISEPSEMHTIESTGLRWIDLDYTESRRQDAYGNWFRFRARVRDGQGVQLGRWAWDVFLKFEH